MARRELLTLQLSDKEISVIMNDAKKNNMTFNQMTEKLLKIFIDTEQKKHGFNNSTNTKLDQG
jgi:hypothetical protein